MEKKLDASIVDGIQVTATTQGGRVMVQANAPAAGVLDGFVNLFSDKDFDIITAGTLSKKGFGTDYVDVSFDKDSAFVSATDYTVVVPASSFERLIARLAKAVIDAAKNGAQVTREKWWTKAVQDANAIITKAYPRGL